MNTHADKSQENKSRSVANGVSQKQTNERTNFQFVDNRPEAIAQRKLQEMANNSPQAMQFKAFQDIANNSPQVKQVAQLQAGSGVIQRVPIAGINVTLSGRMPQWVDSADGLTYHLNLTTDPPHITCENSPKESGKGTEKKHFFFKRKSNGDIVNAVAKKQKGKKKFTDLPGPVQTFVSNNYDAIMAVT